MKQRHAKAKSATLSLVAVTLGVALIVAGISLAMSRPEAAVVDLPPAGSASTTSAPVDPPSVVDAGEPMDRVPLPGIPRELLVPDLGVVAPVVPIDAPDGILIPPADPAIVGWWSAGARPGDAEGSALLTAHTVHAGQAPFNDLETLEKGASVTVLTARGRLDYRVTSVRVFTKGTLGQASASLFSQTVPGRLVLVTCEDWNGSVYLSNVVVIARPA